MAIIDTITDPTRFWGWLQQSGGYKNNFSYEGAKEVQDYYDSLSDSLGEDIEFDPIAWCGEFSEYKNLSEVLEQYDNIKTLDDLKDHTTVRELDNGGLIVEDF